MFNVLFSITIIIIMIIITTKLKRTYVLYKIMNIIIDFDPFLNNNLVTNKLIHVSCVHYTP